MEYSFPKAKSKVEDLSYRKLGLALYFVLTTFLMVYQHSQGWAWDFNVYSLNAEYLFHEGVYMEWKRPPMLPTILGVLQYFFSVRGAEYVFIVLNSGFFLYSVYRLSEEYDVDLLRLYVLVMSPFVIFYSALQGTELLFLSFLTMSLADLKSPKTGFWLGAAFLTRYTGGLFGVLLLFQKDLKKMFYSSVVGGLTVLPWLVFNYFALGHPLGSIADSYALDVVERTVTTSFNPVDPFLVMGLAFPLMLYYLKDLDFDYIDFAMILTGLLVVFRQLGTDIKVRRYLFDLSLPAAFLAVKALAEMDKSKQITYIITGFYIVSSIFLVATSTQGLAYPGQFQEATQETGNCKTVSKVWPFFSYAGTPTGPFEEWYQTEEGYIDEGYRVIVREEGEYVVKGSGCITESFNSTYISRLQEAGAAEMRENPRICAYLPVQTCWFEERLERMVQ